MHRYTEKTVNLQNAGLFSILTFSNLFSVQDNYNFPVSLFNSKNFKFKNQNINASVNFDHYLQNSNSFEGFEAEKWDKERNYTILSLHLNSRMNP